MNLHLRGYIWIKIILVMLTLLLVSCNQVNIEGTWFDPEGETEITFKEDIVYFLGSEGSYEVKNDSIVMTFTNRVIQFEFDLDQDLILYYEDSKLKLQRKVDE